MKRFKMTKRLLAAVLSLVMVLGMVPVIPLTIAAADSDTLDYVSLPITIRDYASDGMLFECNELGYTGTYVSGQGLNLFAEKGLASTWSDSLTDNSDDSFTVSRTQAYLESYEGTSRYLYGNISSVTETEMRYVALKYSQTSVQSGKSPLLQFYSGSTLVASVALNSACNGTTHTVVVDMGYHPTATITQVRYVGHLPKGNSTTIYWAAAFATAEEAQAFVNSDGAGSTVYNHGNNLGYGLLQTNSASKHNVGVNIDGTVLVSNGSFGSSTVPDDITTTLNSGATQIMSGALVRTNLVSAELGANGKPVYTQATVEYLANYMELTLPEVWQSSDGSYNLWYVMGAKHTDLGGKDLATVIREKVTKGTGTYAETIEKASDLTGGNGLDYITTYTDAAYYLLHNTFVDNIGYGQTVSEYNTLNMVAKTRDDGSTYYVFNSAYNNTDYNTTTGVIQNTQTDEIAIRQYNGADWYARGNAQPENSFNPLDQLGYGKSMSNDTYRDVAGLTDSNESSYYQKNNYHLTLEGHAQFVYHYDENLYFTFTGDDDVYLYINGIRVMDLGGAHAISKVTINLNDVMEICGLEEGEAYDFDFFYMERHGTAANFGIETNIKIVDPSMVTTKKAYQDGVAVGYNGYVKVNDPVTYEFGLSNKGETHIYDLTFTDNDIGVAITSTSIKLNGETSMSDLRVTHTAADGTSTVYTDLSEADLMQILADGLAVGETITIYGFNYTIPASEWENDSFINRVETTAVAHYENASTEHLTGVADWMVQKYDVIFGSLHVYDWGKLKNGEFLQVTNGVTLNLDELLAIIETATDAYGRELTTETYPDQAVTISSETITTSNVTIGEFTAGGYASGEIVLGFYDQGDICSLGSYDLSKYTSVEITYGTDGGAMMGDYGTEFVLTDKDGNVLGRATLSNPVAAWKAGSRVVNIPVSSSYSGEVYLSMNMQPRPTTGTYDGAAVNKITFVGKTANAIELSANAKVEVCSASGSTAGGINKNAVVNAAGGITYTSTAVGADVYHYNIVDGNDTYGPITVSVYTYGVADSIFVLDYDLAVELYSNEYGLTANDVVSLSVNPYATSYALAGVANGTTNYGAYTAAGESLTYNLNNKTFMEGIDTVEVTVQVQENDTATLSKFTGVSMTQTVTVAPANVMYYEDGYGAITYINTSPADANGNVWAIYEGENKGTEQSADQAMNYGSDPNYASNKESAQLDFVDIVKNGLTDAEAIQAAINAQKNIADDYVTGDEFVLYGDASNDTIHAMSIQYAANAAIMSFEFQGTGFEILSRTTTEAYAVLTVVVEDLNQGKVVKVIPVISECVNGDLYQIPLVARKNLDYSNYRVTVYTSNAKALDRMVYVDGIRIYEPLGTDGAQYYKADEANATFTEIKTEIKNANVVFGEIAADNTNTDTANSWSFGLSMIENFKNEWSVLTNTVYDENDASSIYTKFEYMTYGPNNEIYLSNATGSNLNFIAFYLVADESVAEEDRSIQVGAHLKDTGDNYKDSDYAATMVYGGRAYHIASGNYTYSVTSGTEQYFSIDTGVLIEIDGRCLLIIGVDDAENDTLVLTNLKLHGYTLYEGIDDELTVIQDIYDTPASELMTETLNLYNYYVAASLRSQLAKVNE